MRLARNEKGIALGIVMLLSLVGLALAAGLLYMTARWAAVAGMEKQYKTAFEAAMGGSQVSYVYIARRGDLRGALDNIPSFTPTIDNACVNLKMLHPTSEWGSTCDNSLTIDIATPATYDARFDLGHYRVYTKIVDTVQGNSAANLGLETANSVANSGTGEVQVFSMPFLYTIEILSQRLDNPNERSRISVLYQY